MKYIYFDAASGLSGDMILGALLDLGIDARLFKQKMAGLRLPVSIATRRVMRGSLQALKVNVRVLRKHPVIRKFTDIERIILRSRFSQAVKDQAVAIFQKLYQVEAKVHGRKFHETHLHEAGADDALVDIVGCCWLSEELNVGAVFCSPLNVGSGWIETSHGVLPVPPPAVAELLKKVPVYSAWSETELVTPTGAAIVATLVRKFTPFPELVYDDIGYGAGQKDLPSLPNVLRAFCGKRTSFDTDRRVIVVETTVDDASPQLLAHFLEKAFEEGALDATLSPVVMKKSRLGTKLTLLAPPEKIDSLIAAVFRETTSIGVRTYPVERHVLQRGFEKVKLAGVPINIKIGSMAGKIVNIQPEYEDCLEASRKMHRPLKEIVHMAVREFQKNR